MEIKCSYNKLVSPEDLVPNKNNPNRHTVEQIKQCADIIEYNGWRNPIVVSNRNGIMTKGHLRLEAAKLKSWKKVPVDFQD